MSTKKISPSAEHQLTEDSHCPGDNQMDSSAQHGAQSNNSKAIVAKPGDIICGRGFHIANHRGNLDLHLLINQYREQYLEAKRPEKTKIIKHVLREINSTSARFIRSVSDGNNVDTWEEVGYATAYKKVSHALRLRTKNESNSSIESMNEGHALQRGGESNGELDNLIPIRRSTLPNLRNNLSSSQGQMLNASASHSTAAGAHPSPLRDSQLHQICSEIYQNTLYVLLQQQQHQQRRQQQSEKPDTDRNSS